MYGPPYPSHNKTYLLIGVIILHACLLFFLLEINSEKNSLKLRATEFFGLAELEKVKASLQSTLPPLEESEFYRNMAKLNCQPGHQKENTPRRKWFQEFFTEESIITRTRDCQRYFSEIPVLGVLDDDLGRSEEFPLAFSHLVNHDIGILEAFLAINFRPADRHCIYVDRKADPRVVAAVHGLVKCYRERFYGDASSNQGLFVYDWTNPVTWGHISVLEADMACLRQMLLDDQSNVNPWKYYFNLDGGELPLRTEKWIRQMLRGLQGQSITDGHKIHNSERLTKTNFIHWLVLFDLL